MNNELEFLQRIRKLVVVAMFSDDVLMSRLVLKGGNLVDLVYNISARSSLDVDFSIDGDFPQDVNFAGRVEDALAATFSEDGYVVFDVRFREVPPVVSDDLKDYWGGYQVEFKLISQRRFGDLTGDIDQMRREAEKIGKGQSPKFKIDFSKHEFCDAKEEYYLNDYPIYGQSPGMCVSEKLRAICQQMDEYRQTVGKHLAFRAKDFLDVYVVSEFFPIDFADRAFQQLVRQTFAAKNVPLQLIAQLESVREIHRESFETVRATVKPAFPIRDYDFYFDYVLQHCQKLEAFWNE